MTPRLRNPQGARGFQFRRNRIGESQHFRMQGVTGTKWGSNICEFFREKWNLRIREKFHVRNVKSERYDICSVQLGNYLLLETERCVKYISLSSCNIKIFHRKNIIISNKMAYVRAFKKKHTNIIKCCLIREFNLEICERKKIVKVKVYRFLERQQSLHWK